MLSASLPHWQSFHTGIRFLGRRNRNLLPVGCFELDRRCCGVLRIVRGVDRSVHCWEGGSCMPFCSLVLLLSELGLLMVLCFSSYSLVMI